MEFTKRSDFTTSRPCSLLVGQAYRTVNEGCKTMNDKQQRDEDEQKKIIAMIRDLKARGVHNSAKVIEKYHYITLAK